VASVGNQARGGEYEGRGGITPERFVESKFGVRYAEADAMGVVYHANYLVWFEVGRGDYFRALDQDYGEWEEMGYFLPVSEAYARFVSPARYGDLILVRTRLEEARSRGLTLRYEVCLAESLRGLVTGWTKHFCTDRQGRVCRLPQALFLSLDRR
jgi:acyl-CoA thioester hydrolase